MATNQIHLLYLYFFSCRYWIRKDLHIFFPLIVSRDIFIKHAYCQLRIDQPYQICQFVLGYKKAATFIFWKGRNEKIVATANSDWSLELWLWAWNSLGDFGRSLFFSLASEIYCCGENLEGELLEERQKAINLINEEIQ